MKQKFKIVNKKLKKGKKEQGSIALFVLLTCLFFLVVVTSMVIDIKNKETKIDAEIAKIKANYEKDVGDEETIYNEKLRKKDINTLDPSELLPSIKSWTYNSNTDFHEESIRNIITEIEFVDYLPNPVTFNEKNCWDISQKENKSVIAWLDGTKLYIGGDGGLKANEDSSYLFYSFPNLERINFNQNYNTKDTKNMSHMFANSVKLESLDLKYFITSNVTNMRDMFAGATRSPNSELWSSQSKMALSNIEISTFDTSQVTDFVGMFANCPNLSVIDLTSFDTHNATNINDMFNMPNDGSAKLKTIYVGDKWTTDNVKGNAEDLFDQCLLLTGGNGTRFNTDSILYAKIDKNGQPGYFTDIRQNYIEKNEELEYLETTGMQYVDIGYTFTSNNFKFKVGCSFNSYNGELDFVGNNSGSTNFVFGLYYNKPFIYEHGNNSFIAEALPINIQHDITGVIYSGKKYMIVDGVKTDEYNLASLSDFSNNRIIIFAQGPSLKYKFIGKIYYFKFYENNQLVKSFIPVHNTITDSAGLYDTVEEKFYASNGTEAFIEGNKVNNNN